MKILSTFVILAACTQNILARGIVKRETHLEECKFINALLGQDENYDCCQVDRIECSDDGHVINIDNPEITKRDLPESIGTMPYLENLDLSVRDLKGNLPQDIGNLKRIKYLSFNENKIEGTIPESIGNLSTLEHLHLQDNDLEGIIPSAIGKCSKLSEFLVNHNRLSGEIPSAEFENLSSLNYFNVEDNENLYGRAPNNKVFYSCYYKNTKLCYSENDKNEVCDYPETHYECNVCKDDKVSTLVDNYCTCNEGYTGPAYIGCTKVDNNSSNTNTNNGNTNTNTNSNDNKTDSNSGALTNVSSMKLLHLALAAFTIGMLYI